MSIHTLVVGMLALLVACQPADVGSSASRLDEPQDLSIRICGHFKKSTSGASLPCASTPADAYSATEAQRVSECQGNSSCLRSEIYLLIATPTPPVPESYMQEYMVAAGKVERFMASRDIRGYQLTLQELATGARIIGKAETESLTREYEKNLKQATTDKIATFGSMAVGAEHALFVRKSDAIKAVKRLNERYATTISQLADRFANLVTQYQHLRSTELAAIEGLTAAVGEASHNNGDASLTALTNVINVARSESGQTNGFVVEASRFRGELEAATNNYNAEVSLYRDVMQEFALPALDFSTRSDVSVDSMINYAQQRDARVSDASARVVVQIRLRLHALEVAAASEAVREDLADAALLKASTDFLATSNARVAEILRTAEKSPELGLSLLAPMQRDMVAFLQLEAPCEARGNSNPWMNTGCNVLAPNFSKARQFLSTRIPGTIRIDAGTFRRHNAPATTVAAMEQQLAAGNIEAACRTHDELISIVETQEGN